MREIEAVPAQAPRNDAPMRLVCLALVLALLALLLRIVGTVELALASSLPAVTLADDIMVRMSERDTSAPIPKFASILRRPQMRTSESKEH